MVKNQSKPKVKKDRNLSRFVVKPTAHEVKTFVSLLTSLMKQTGCPKVARVSYINEVKTRLRNEGAPFLKMCRSFPVMGAKLLGKDLTGFPIQGLRTQKDKEYPKLFSWYWAELKSLSEIEKPTNAHLKRARSALTVLSFARMIKTSSLRQIKIALDNYEKTISDPGFIPDDSRPDDATEEAKADKVADPAEDWSGSDFWIKCFGTKRKENLNSLPKYLDLSSLSLKPSALREVPRFPKYFRSKIGGASKRVGLKALPAPKYGFKDPPFGKIHVIVETGGKLRQICPYNTPFVHSTGLYTRVRSLLDSLKEDCSHDQSKGHVFAQSLSRKGMQMVSSDLSDYSDTISKRWITSALEFLGLPDLERYLFNLPVQTPGGNTIVPKKLLMGLRGTFEVASLLHHYYVRSNDIENYVLCGDDLLYAGQLEQYTKNINVFGVKLNRQKTIVSSTVCVFCGEYFWRGNRVKPVTLKVSSIFEESAGVSLAGKTFSVYRHMYSSLREFMHHTSVLKILKPIFKRLCEVYKGYIAFNLPIKLRGLGFPSHRPGGLLSVLAKKSNLVTAKYSIPDDKVIPEMSRWFGLPIIIGDPKTHELVSSALPSLMKRGATQLDIPKPKKIRKKNIGSSGLHEVLEFYYYSVHIAPVMD